MDNQDVYGIVASMLGIDALNAADQDLILSSAFPMLKIETVKEITLATTASATHTLYTHDLGYPPFFILWERTSNGLLQEFFGDVIEVDSDKITIQADATTTRDFVVMVCRNPLNKIIATSVFQTQSREAALRDRDFGLIVAKEGKSTDSEDMRDFTFHSNTRNLLIHAVDHRALVPNEGGVPEIVWTNDLPYRPIFFGFISLDGGNSYRLSYGGEQSPPSANQAEGGDISITSFDPGDGTVHYGSIWVFKDPFDIGATEQVVI